MFPSLRAQGKRHSSARFRPELESLEGRWTPSAVISYPTASRMVITADDLDQTITIHHYKSGGGWFVSAVVQDTDGTVTATNGGNIQFIDVYAGGGADKVDYILKDGPFDKRLDMYVDLGAGDDRSDFNFTRGFKNARVDLDVIGGTGNDLVTGRFGAFDKSVVVMGSKLGEGDDAYNYYSYGALTNNTRFRNHIMGENGNDSVSMHAEGIDIEAGSLLDVYLGGNAGNDVVTFYYSGELDGSLLFQLDGNFGEDEIATYTTAEAGSTGALGVLIRGGDGNDVMTAVVCDHSADDGGPGLSYLAVVVNGGSGYDTCYKTDNVLDQNCEKIDQRHCPHAELA